MNVGTQELFQWSRGTRRRSLERSHERDLCDLITTRQIYWLKRVSDDVDPSISMSSTYPILVKNENSQAVRDVVEGTCAALFSFQVPMRPSQKTVVWSMLFLDGHLSRTLWISIREKSAHSSIESTTVESWTHRFLGRRRRNRAIFQLQSSLLDDSVMLSHKNTYEQKWLERSLMFERCRLKEMQSWSARNEIERERAKISVMYASLTNSEMVSDDVKNVSASRSLNFYIIVSGEKSSVSHYWCESIRPECRWWWWRFCVFFFFVFLLNKFCCLKVLLFEGIVVWRYCCLKILFFGWFCCLEGEEEGLVWKGSEEIFFGVGCCCLGGNVVRRTCKVRIGRVDHKWTTLGFDRVFWNIWKFVSIQTDYRIEKTFQCYSDCYVGCKRMFDFVMTCESHWQ